MVELDPALLHKMRAIFQFQPEVAHVYLGGKQHLLHRVFTDANAPLYKSAKVLPLGPIATGSFAPFIQERFLATSNRIAPAAVEHVLANPSCEAHGLASYRSVDYALDALTERSLKERQGPHHFSVPDVFFSLWLRSTYQ